MMKKDIPTSLGGTVSLTLELLPTIFVGNLEIKNILFFQEFCNRCPPEFSKV